MTVNTMSYMPNFFFFADQSYFLLRLSYLYNSSATFVLNVSCLLTLFAGPAQPAQAKPITAQICSLLSHLVNLRPSGPLKVHGPGLGDFFPTCSIHVFK